MFFLCNVRFILDRKFTIKVHFDPLFNSIAYTCVPWQSKYKTRAPCAEGQRLE